VSLRSLAYDVIDNVDGALGNHSVAVHGTAAYAFADPYAVTRILLSLLTNAAQYSPDGTTIDVETSSCDGRAVVTVTDSGPGIPDGEREAVFARFWRGAWARGRVRGLGVGLSIARDLCELSGGDIHLCDGSHPGARFEVVLPAAN
jgi:signal transduction histidine kinase